MNNRPLGATSPLSTLLKATLPLGFVAQSLGLTIAQVMAVLSGDEGGKNPPLLVE